METVLRPRHSDEGFEKTDRAKLNLVLGAKAWEALALAETLRDESVKVKVLRSTLVKALVHPEIRTAFDVFGSDLPNEVFAGVFEQPRQRQWREINL